MKNVLALINEQETNTSIEWEKPISFDEEKLLEFDTSIFPQWLRDYIEAVSESTQTAPDASAMASIAMLSTILSKLFEVNPRGDWNETLNTYTIMALPSANRKSGVFREFTYPIIEHEKEQGQLLELAIAQQEEKLKALEKRLEHLRKEYGKSKDQDIMDELLSTKEEIESEQIITKPRYSTSDATPEVLADLMAKNNEKIAILSAEGGEAFDMMAGRYSSNGKSNIDIYLKGHAADDVAIDRIGRESIKLYSPTLTIGLFLQPDVVKDIPQEFQGRGLTQRFLYSFPRSWLGYRDKEPNSVPGDIRNKFESNVKKLLQLKSDTPIILSLSEEAKALQRVYSYEIEELLKDEDNTDAFQGWIGKIEGQMLRIASLLHIAKYVSNNIADIPTDIETETIESTKHLREYFMDHAKKAHGIMGVDGDESQAKYLLNKIIELKEEKTSARELLRKARKFKTSDELKNSLHILEERGFIKIQVQGNRFIVLVNPQILY